MAIHDGFPGQRIAVLPRPIVDASLKNELGGDVLPTASGYFPQAQNHEIHRETGSPDAILIYCLRGAGWCEIRGIRHRAGPGDVVGIAPGQPHAYGADIDQPWTIAWCHLAGRQSANWLQQLALTPDSPVVHTGESSEVASLFEELCRTLENGYAPPRLLYASGLLRCMLGLLNLTRSQPHRAQRSTDERIAEAAETLRRNVRASVSIPELAAACNLSSSHFAFAFKRRMGYSVLEYFIRQKMQFASQLLDTTDMPVKRIAE